MNITEISLDTVFDINLQFDNIFRLWLPIAQHGKFSNVVVLFYGKLAVPGTTFAWKPGGWSDFD